MGADKIERNLDEKLNHTIDVMGELKYKVIEHPIIDNSKISDIMTLKVVINKLKEVGDIFYITKQLCMEYFSYDYIKGLSLENIQSHIESATNLLDSGTLWIRFDDYCDFDITSDNDNFTIDTITNAVLVKYKILYLLKYRMRFPKIDMTCNMDIETFDDFVDMIITENEKDYLISVIDYSTQGVM